MFSDWAMSPERDRLLVSGSKGLLQIAKDRSFGRVAELGPDYSGKPIELPWDGSVFVGAVGTSSSVILEKSGRVRPVQGEAQRRSDTFHTHVELPSLKTIILGSGGTHSGYGFTLSHYLGPDDTIARLTDEKGKAIILNEPPMDTPWLGGALVNYFGLKLFRPGEPLRPLSLAGNWSGQIAAVQAPRWYPRAVPRFRFVLMTTRDGWKRLTEDRWILEVPGIDPATSHILSIADPGRGDVLLGTSDGLYRINEQGMANPIPEAGRGAVRLIQQSSALDGLMAGGENGLFRVVDGSRVVAVDGGDAMTIGAVFGVVDVPWARLTLIAAARGFFVLDRDGALTRLDAGVVGGRSPFQHMSAFAEMQGVFVFGPARHQSRGAIYELGRRNSAGACTEPL
jgi:hypothetical protein